VALDNDEFALERTGLRLDQSAGAQHDGESRFAHESDEADTKLNLAKAYIELGDSEGARTILDEVTREGSAAQQQEARQLLSQLA
jgi:pilus assembly protein FimV